jgi:peptide/nickel transport system substrate-binding protein
LWNNGMQFTILYNTGNVARQTAAETWTANIKSLNPLFNLNPAQGVAWGSVYLPAMVNGELPIFIIGWLADYADPDNFVFPFMHSQGTFSAWQKYNNPRVDELITAGATTNDDPVGPYDVAGKPFDVGDPRPLFNNLQPIYGGTVPGGTNMPPDTTYPRRSIYYELQAIYYADNPGICLVQALGRHFSRGWVQKWYYNNLYPGFYYGHLYKQETHLGDANRDASVNVADLGWISGRWSAVALSPPGSTANVEGDINGGTGGTTGKLSGAAPGIPDGTVDVIDLALVSAYWDTGPTGPSHP